MIVKIKVNACLKMIYYKCAYNAQLSKDINTLYFFILPLHPGKPKKCCPHVNAAKASSFHSGVIHLTQIWTFLTPLGHTKMAIIMVNTYRYIWQHIH